jgi:myo-inositol-1(or 4)-monophosphatase
MATQSAIITVMVRAAEKAGRGLKRDFGEVEQLQVSKKGPGDFVSVADHKSEKLIFEELSKARPGYAFLMEEGGQQGDPKAENRFIIDPLDGTTNFLHGLPHWCISIAYENKGTIIAGVIHDPIKDETFWAEKGKGAYLNDKRLRVAARRSIDEAVLATGIPFLGKPGHGVFLKELHQISQRVSGVRRFGSAALDLAYVAAGRFDGYWERGLKNWDMAAGTLLVTEAGGKVTHVDGGEMVLTDGTVLAANLELHPQVLGLIKAAQ